MELPDDPPSDLDEEARRELVSRTKRIVDFLDTANSYRTDTGIFPEVLVPSVAQIEGSTRIAEAITQLAVAVQELGAAVRQH